MTLNTSISSKRIAEDLLLNLKANQDNFLHVSKYNKRSSGLKFYLRRAYNYTPEENGGLLLTCRGDHVYPQVMGKKWKNRQYRIPPSKVKYAKRYLKAAISKMIREWAVEMFRQNALLQTRMLEVMLLKQ